MASAKIRLGTASPCTQSTTAETLAQLSQIAQRAAGKQIDILLLPEAYLGGYPRGSSFGCVIGNRSTEGREEFLKYWNNAVDLGDTVGDGAGAGAAWVGRELENGTKGVEKRGDGTREELERISKETGVFIVTGCIEKAGGSMYCSVVYVCPKLGMVGKRRKVMPTGTERLVWAQGSPTTLRAVSTVIRGVRVNLAAAICWENYMPLLRQALYTQNVNLYLAPTADGRDAWLSLLRTIGIEGRCFVISSNMCVRGKASETRGTKAAVNEHEHDPEDHSRKMSQEQPPQSHNSLPMENMSQKMTGETHRTEILSRGGSCIVSPFGDVLAGPQWEDDENIIYTDVDFEDCIRGRLDLDVAGSYSRNDSFKFAVQGLNLDPLPY